MSTKKKYLALAVYSLLILLLNLSSANAGNYPSHHRLYTVGSNTVGVGATFTLTSSLPSISPVYFDKQVSDLLTLGVDHTNPSFFPVAQKVSVLVKIEQYNLAGTLINTVNKTMTIQYQPFSSPLPDQDRSTYPFSGAYSLKVTILSIGVNGPPTPGTLLPANLYIDADINVERYYDFSSDGNNKNAIVFNPPTFVNLDCDANNTMDELHISWNGVPGAEAYDLEWTYVNDYLTDPALTGPFVLPAQLNYDFKNNSTRITTTNLSYNITLAFEHGYVLYRIRGTGKSIVNGTADVIGVWSSPDADLVSNSTNKVSVVPHEGLLNWQFSSTYAEEGKKKEVISYFDGSLHNRQSVTKMNSQEKNALVGETIYDHQGRPAVNVLPVPVISPTCTTAVSTNESALKYYPKFNLNDNGSPAIYSRDDFDNDVSPTLNCVSQAGGMSTTSGASNYYSSSNPDQNAQQAFLPDAQKFPFTRIEYTPDNTGRIRSQGGAGPEFQIGSAHETKYYYGQPNQIELDRMFGSETGNCAHYKKNVVIDANGQASISYLDQEGRTVATCLAGPSPANVNALTTISSPTLLSNDLFSKDALGKSSLNTITVDSDAIEFNSQIIVTNISNYTFNYDMQISPLTDACLNPGICFNCVYDLEIRVTDDCGNNMTPPLSNIVGHFFRNKSGLIKFTTACSPFNYSNSFTINNLPVGNYTVSKILTVNKDARDFYIQEYLDNVNINSCAHDLAYFTNLALAQVDPASCEVTCTTCIAALGTKDQFVASGRGTDMDYDLQYEQCNALCKDISPCEVAYQQLLADMSPSGQYGEFPLNGLFAAGQYPLSVYNKANLLPIRTPLAPNWTNPQTNVNGTTYRYYIGTDNKKAWVAITPPLGNWSFPLNMPAPTTFIPQVFASDVIHLSYDPASGTWYTTPDNLLNFTDFISNWDAGWAKGLVIYHPEYGDYQACSGFGTIQPGDKITSDDFDSGLENTLTFAQAVTNGYIKPNYLAISLPTDRVYDFTLASSVHHDPFATNSSFQPAGTGFQNIANTLHTAFNTYMTIGGTPYTMAQTAAIAASCGNLFGGSVGTNCPLFGNDLYGPFIPNHQFLNDSVRDSEWAIFKNFYLSAKQALQKKRDDYLNVQPPLNSLSSFNGCIGNSSFNPAQAGMLNPWATPPYFDPKQPCSAMTRWYYAGKKKRFIQVSDMPTQNQNEVQYQLYLQTGQCPMAFNLQNTLNAIAVTRNLTNHNGVLLSSFADFSPDMYKALNALAVTANVILPSGNVPYQWKALSINANSLSGVFGYYTATGPPTFVQVCYVSLQQTGNTVSWNSLVGIKLLQAIPGVAGTAYQFNCTGEFPTAAGSPHPFAYVNLFGNTKMDIEDCSFQPECQPTDFASDLGTLMSMIASSGQLTSTTAVNLETSVYSPLLTQNILNTLGTPNTSLYWRWQSGLTEFMLYDINSPTGSRVALTFDSYSPSSFTFANLGSITSFGNINGGHLNKFTIDGFDATGNKLVTITGSANMEGAGFQNPLNMGKCDLPTPQACQGSEYQVRSDLEALLRDELTKKPLASSIDLTTDPYFTSLLKSYLPVTHSNSAINFSSTSVVSFVTTPAATSFENMVITFDGVNSHCTISLSHLSSSGNPIQFSNMTDFQNLTGVPPINIDGSYSAFTANATYTVGGTTYTDIIHGTSTCIPILNCTCTPRAYFDITDCSANGMPSTSHSVNSFQAPTKPVNYTEAEINAEIVNWKPGIVASVDSTKSNPLKSSITKTPSTNTSSCWNYALLPQAPSATIASVITTIINNNVSATTPAYFYKHPWEGATPWSAPFDGIGLSWNATGSSSANASQVYYLYERDFTLTSTLSYLDLEMMGDNEVYVIINNNFAGGVVNNGGPLTTFRLGANSEYLHAGANRIRVLVKDDSPTNTALVIRGRVISLQTCAQVQDTLTAIPAPPIVNACLEYQINLAHTNAINAYNQYTDGLKAQISGAYMRHCLSALENLSDTYNDQQYHYTLYYYDQAGNLVKTVPPEGVQLLNITNSTSYDYVRIQNDILNHTRNVHTDHLMATVYDYNSLNQLVKQSVPDHDKIPLLQYLLPNGLDSRLTVTSTQFITAALGYLTGYITLPASASPFRPTQRGYLYSTTDGGNTWTLQTGYVASDMNKVQMVNANIGYAVGAKGTVIKTIDGGANWDILPGVYSIGVTADLNDLYFVSPTTGMIVGANGTALYTTDGGTNFTLSNTNIAATDVLTSVTNDGTTYYASGTNITGSGVIYSCLTPPTWTRQTNFSVAANLNKVEFLQTTTALNGLNKGFAGGDGGAFLATTNAGVNWNAIATGMSTSIRDFHFRTALIGVALIDSVPGYSQLWSTADGGNNWSLLSTVGDYYNGMFFYTNNVGYAVGKKGLIKRIVTNNAGIAPYFGLIGIPSPVTTDLETVSAIANTATTITLITTGSAGTTAYAFYSTYSIAGASVPMNWNPIAGFPTTVTTDLHMKKTWVLMNGTNFRSAFVSTTGRLYTAIQNGATVTMHITAATGNYRDLIASGANLYTFGNTAKKLYRVNFAVNPPTLVLNNTNGTSTIVQANSIGFTSATAAGTPNLLVQVGNSGEIFTGTNVTTPATITYTSRTNNTTPLSLTDITGNGTAKNIYATGTNGTLIQTIDGVHWKSLVTNTATDLNAIAFLTANTGFIAGDNASLYTLTVSAGNVAMTSVPVPGSDDLTDISLNASSGTGYISGSLGSVFYIPVTSTPVPAKAQLSITGSGFQGIGMLPSGTAIAVGDGASVCMYAGLNGAPINSLFTPALNDVHFVNSNNGYVVGDVGTIRHTSNAGGNWNTVAPFIPATGVKKPAVTKRVWTVAPDIGIVIGNNSAGTAPYLASIQNTALPVSVVPVNNTATSFNAIAFMPGTLGGGYIAGDKSTVIGITVTGTTVTTSHLPTSSAITGNVTFNALHVFNDGSVIGCGANTHVWYYDLYSTASQTIQHPKWYDYTPSPALTPLSNLKAIFFHDDRTGYIAGDQGALYKCVLIKDIEDLNTNNSSAWGAPQLTVADGFNVPNASPVDIRVLTFPERFKGFVAGTYASSFTNASNYPYARILKDEALTWSTYFWYDRLGRMAISQNTKQFMKVPTAFSYTQHDALGRVSEVGEKTENTTAGNSMRAIFGTTVNGVFNPNVIDDSRMYNWLIDLSGVKKEVTHTFYDDQFYFPQLFNYATGTVNTFVEQNLRKRVASVTFEAKDDNNSATYDHATHYSYDIHGNIITVVQENPSLAGISTTNPQQFKSIDYEYDLISGNVNTVHFQNKQIDAYHHHFEYDADNRVTEVFTSKYPLAVWTGTQNDPIWDRDLKYKYYANGPIARKEVGDLMVQGMDYAVTIQGLTKGVNSNTLDPIKDIGQDGFNPGNNSNTNQNFARDAFGFTLDYFQGDYSAINSAKWQTTPNNNRFESVTSGSDFSGARSDIFNGNVSGMVTTISSPTNYGITPINPNILPLGTAYQYDQLNRLIEMKGFQDLDVNTNTWKNGSSYSGMYNNKFTYDANGNILTALAKNQAGQIIDNQIYQYQTICSGGGCRVNNRLYAINDFATQTSGNDIPSGQTAYDNTSATINATNNYGYDELGHLIRDNQKEIAKITWSVYGKVLEVIRKSGSSKYNLKFDYDVQNKRIAKHVLKSDGITIVKTEYYLRDASGNLVSTYVLQNDPVSNSSSFALTERHIFGKTEVGIETTRMEMIGAPSISSFDTINRYLGNKHYTGENHLGNVLCVFTDKKIPRDDNGDGVIDYYQPEIVAANDYAPFGGLLSERTFVKFAYPNSFNDKRNDSELDDGQDYGSRMYGTWSRRFWSVDPISSQFPWYSPYQFAGNKPIMAKDLDGFEEQKAIDGSTVYGPYDINLVNRDILTKNGFTEDQIKQIMGPKPATTVYNPVTIVPSGYESFFSAGKGGIDYNFSIGIEKKGIDLKVGMETKNGKTQGKVELGLDKANASIEYKTEDGAKLTISNVSYKSGAGGDYDIGIPFLTSQSVQTEVLSFTTMLTVPGQKEPMPFVHTYIKTTTEGNLFFQKGRFVSIKDAYTGQLVFHSGQEGVTLSLSKGIKGTPISIGVGADILSKPKVDVNTTVPASGK